MKKTVLMALLVGSFVSGQTGAAKAAVKKQEAVTLPAGAKKTADGVWEHTDGEGRQWVYKQMPFGLT